MRVFVTGAAGFIGSNLTDCLLALGDEVTGYDNLCTGRAEFLVDASRNPSFRLLRGDVLDLDSLMDAIAGAEIVFHLAANADVRSGTEHPRKDLEQNTIATWNVLEAMRRTSVRRIVFASTGSIYGEPELFPTPESCPFPVQTSFYGASKLAAEGLIQAYCEGFGMQGYIFRFVSILGERYQHGHVIDFYRQLIEHPHHLYILGDGTQRKSYLHVRDCIAAMLLAVQESGSKVNIFNLGTSEYCQVTDSVRWICGHLGLNPQLTFAGGGRGWIGDSPFIFLDCSRIRALGWQPQCSIQQGVISTVDYLKSNRWLLSK